MTTVNEIARKAAVALNQEYSITDYFEFYDENGCVGEDADPYSDIAKVVEPFINEALEIVKAEAQSMREEGECDMRDIIHFIRKMNGEK